jgi:hypothetical protein
MLFLNTGLRTQLTVRGGIDWQLVHTGGGVNDRGR